MITSVLHTTMVVKHIKINKRNKKKLQKMIDSQKRDWVALSILALVLAVAIVGLLLNL